MWQKQTAAIVQILTYCMETSKQTLSRQEEVQNFHSYKHKVQEVCK